MKINIETFYSSIKRPIQYQFWHRGVAGLYNSNPFATSALGRATLPPEKIRYSSYKRVGGPRVLSGRTPKISPPLGFDPRTVQFVASCYTDRAIPAASTVLYINIYLHLFIPNWFAGSETCASWILDTSSDTIVSFDERSP